MQTFTPMEVNRITTYSAQANTQTPSPHTHTHTHTHTLTHTHRAERPQWTRTHILSTQTVGSC
jgi:hypothetical protein